MQRKNWNVVQSKEKQKCFWTNSGISTFSDLKLFKETIGEQIAYLGLSYSDNFCSSNWLFLQLRWLGQVFCWRVSFWAENWPLFACTFMHGLFCMHFFANNPKNPLRRFSLSPSKLCLHEQRNCVARPKLRHSYLWAACRATSRDFVVMCKNPLNRKPEQPFDPRRNEVLWGYQVPMSSAALRQCKLRKGKIRKGKPASKIDRNLRSSLEMASRMSFGR
jgi:hypothetical protein